MASTRFLIVKACRTRHLRATDPADCYLDQGAANIDTILAVPKGKDERLNRCGILEREFAPVFFCTKCLPLSELLHTVVAFLAGCPYNLRHESDRRDFVRGPFRTRTPRSSRTHSRRSRTFSAGRGRWRAGRLLLAAAGRLVFGTMRRFPGQLSDRVAPLLEGRVAEGIP